MKGEAFYEFYIRGSNVFGVGYRPFISDVLYNMELPGRPVNEYDNGAVYVGVYGTGDKVAAAHSFLTENRPPSAVVSEVSKPVKTAEPLHEIPSNLNDMHIHASHLALSQMTAFVEEAQKLRSEVREGFASLASETRDGFSKMSDSITSLSETLQKK